MSASRAHEISGHYMSNLGASAEPMKDYMSVHDFIFCDRSLVGRFDHINPTLQHLQQWSAKLWRPQLTSNWMFKIRGAGFFKIEFFYEDDCQFVLNNGPWFMGEVRLSLGRWSPDFDPQNPGPFKTPIWVRNISRSLCKTTNFSINMSANQAREVPGNDLSNSGADFMSVDDFIFHDKSLVGRFVHMNPTVQEFSRWSGMQWSRNLRSKWIFKILGEGFFKIEFFYDDDCQFVLNNASWFMREARLSLERWSPYFDFQNPCPFKTTIWMRNISRSLCNSTNFSINMSASLAHEVPGNDLSNSGADYMSVDDFIFHDKSLVGRFVHMSPTVQEFSRWSEMQWSRNLRSKWILKILGEGVFKIEFFYEDDCQFVLNKDPWFMGEARLSLERWPPYFDPQNLGPFKTPIWVRNISRSLCNSTDFSINMSASRAHEVPCNNLSNSGANYMSVDDFIFHDKSLVGRFVHMNPTVQEFSQWLGMQWRNMRSKCIFKILGEGFFKIEFFYDDDCQLVLNDGPRYMGVEELSLRRWSTDFNFRNPSPFL